MSLAKAPDSSHVSVATGFSTDQIKPCVTYVDLYASEGLISASFLEASMIMSVGSFSEFNLRKCIMYKILKVILFANLCNMCNISL